MRVLTAEAMQAVDRFAIEELGIPSLVLMENAAIGVTDAIGERFPEARSIAVFCGPGNNGGDGLAIARQLDGRGYAVAILLAAGSRGLQGDAAAQLRVCERIGLEVVTIEGAAAIDSAVRSAAACDLIVDALFGTGLSRPLEGRYAELVARIEEVDRPLVAVDIPSGLSGSRADLFGPHLTAELTVTFAAPKIPHFLSPAASAVGEVVVADLGIPAEVVDRADGDLRLLLGEELGLLLEPRDLDGHKGTYGHALIFGGSEGKSGAALLATRAAIRAGAGLVTTAVPRDLLPVLEASSLESMTVALPVEESGGLSAAALDTLLEAASGKQAVAVGPGLGAAPATGEVVRRAVAEIESPVVLDADGLNAFSGRIDDLAERSAPTILTPHPMELARLLGVSKERVQADRAGAARQAAERSGAVVALKGHRTLVADIDGIGINTTGNPGMATGGAGDVLTGLIAGLLAQGRSPVEAAELGVFSHGLAGDLALELSGEISLAAGDLLAQIPEALRLLKEGR
jgi:NAD(P)H-hydrate epimerase